MLFGSIIQQVPHKNITKIPESPQKLQKTPRQGHEIPAVRSDGAGGLPSDDFPQAVGKFSSPQGVDPEEGGLAAGADGGEVDEGCAIPEEDDVQTAQAFPFDAFADKSDAAGERMELDDRTFAASGRADRKILFFLERRFIIWYNLPNKPIFAYSRRTDK